MDPPFDAVISESDVSSDVSPVESIKGMSRCQRLRIVSRRGLNPHSYIKVSRDLGLKIWNPLSFEPQTLS